MVVLQAESEVASINMVIWRGCLWEKSNDFFFKSRASALCRKESLIWLAQNCHVLLLNVVRGGPGLGTIQPSQADYFQSTKGGGHGDYHMIVLAPSSVQEMYDFVALGFELAFKYRNPVMVLIRWSNWANDGKSGDLEIRNHD